MPSPNDSCTWFGLVSVRSLPCLLLVIFANAAPARDLLSDINRYIRAEMDLNQITGLSLAIVSGNEPPLTRAYGVKDLSTGEPMTSATPVDLASVSKSFTGLAVAQLIEAGKVDPDAPVSRYVPNFRVGGASGSNAITVRHLLEHRSGLTRSADYLAPCCVGSNGQNFPEALRTLGGAKLRGRPPAQFRYANSNYIVLAALVEGVARQPFAAYMQTHVFAPLAMPRTTLDRAQAEAWGLAAYHEQQWGRVERGPSEFTGWLGSSGVKSTAEDMARYIEIMLYGEPVPVPPAVSLVRRSLAEPANGYRFGWFINQQADWLDGARVWEHSGDIWGANSAVVLAPGRGAGVAVMINAGAHRARAVARGVLARTIGVSAPPPATVPWEQVPDNLAIAAGAGSMLLLLILTAHLVRVRREFRGGTRRFHWQAGRYQVLRAALLVAMAAYLIARVFAGPRPFEAYPTTLRAVIPLLTAAMTALLLVTAALSFAPRQGRPSNRAVTVRERSSSDPHSTRRPLA